jgi:hypothetical protein
MPPTIYRIRPDSNLLYLPFVYFLPEDVIVSCPTLRSLPRCVGEIQRSDKLMEIIGSDIFFKEIMEAIAALVFPHFGFRGWKEHYSSDCPAWRLSYLTPIWWKALEDETGWGLQRLLSLPSTATIPLFDPDYIAEAIRRAVERVLVNDGWQAVFDVIKEMPCDEDFMNWDTNVRKDFLRKLYHTRSKNVQTVSLEACLEDDEHGIHEIEDVSSDFQDRVAGEDFCQRFKARLSQKDMEILELRVEGFTYEEIADKLGYKNHSGVIKRMQAITKAFTKYEDEQGR